MRFSRLRRSRLFASTLVACALLAGCASSPQDDLAGGACPAYIVFPGERSQQGRARYGESITDAELARYRDREVANCEARLAAGDTSAMAALLEYWHATQNSRQVVEVLRTFVETGSDQRELAQASAELYEIYSKGRPGVPADPDAAFHYLGLAREFEPATWELPYANALHERGMYADAFTLLDGMLNRPGEQTRLTRSQRCEIQLKLADLYFRGRGVRENWNIGYYYWLGGLAEADDAAWGSCDKQTYYNHERYAYESGRRKEIERRVQAMGEVEAGKIRAARGASGGGLEAVAAMQFRRPLYRESVASAPPPESAAPALAAPMRDSYPAWPAWAPTGGELCQWRTSFQPQRWSDVFQQHSGAIWSVKSQAAGAKTMGSAVAVSPSLLLTNCHIIGDSAQVTLLRVGSSIPAEVVAADRAGDRCILRATQPLADYVTTARREQDLLVGEDVAAIGNPRGLDTSLSRGLVAQKRNRNGRALIQTDAAISSGSSGGGLFDASGNLVGITTFKVSDGESLNFAIAIDEFCR